jgi:hypothetical protein
MAPIFNPLANPSTSRVLFLLILGVDTPKEIADRLKIRPPSAIDQLHRLRRIRLTRLGSKTGRQQHYKLDWDRLVETSVKRSFTLPQPEMREQNAADSFADQFLKKKEFLEFIKSYLLARVEETPQNLLIEGNETFSDILDDLDRTMVGMMSNEKLRNDLLESCKNDQRLRDVFDSLDLWRDAHSHVSDISRKAFARALQESGFRVASLRIL